MALGLALNACGGRVGPSWNIKDGQRMQFSQEFGETRVPQGAEVTSVVITEVTLPTPPDFTRTLIEPRGPIIVFFSNEQKSKSSRFIIKSDFINYQPIKDIRGAGARLYSKEGAILAVIVQVNGKEICLIPSE